MFPEVHAKPFWFGTIRGYLPAHLSNFVSEKTGQTAPLWRITYDDKALGEEDMEMHEVEEHLIHNIDGVLKKKYKDGYWQVSGCNYLGGRVLRNIPNKLGKDPAVHFGTVSAWLPVQQADFVR